MATGKSSVSVPSGSYWSGWGPQQLPEVNCGQLGSIAVASRRNGSTHMMGIGIDVTDLKTTEQSLRASEEKYRNLFENTARGIFLAKPDGSLLEVKPRPCNHAGLHGKGRIASL
jgi:PAS domain-containing protein